MKFSASVLALFNLAFLGGCHSASNVDPFAKIKTTKVDMKEFEEDLIVPNALWKSMESVYRPMALDAEGKAAKEGAEGGEKKEEAKEEAKPEEKKEGGEGKPEKEGGEGKSEVEDLLKKKPPLDPIPVTVYLVEKTTDVLGGQSYELKYSPGGGILDYRAFVPENKDGTFYLKVKYDVEMDPKDTHIYYLSNAKVREIENKPLGNGCSRYYDISQYWNNQMKGEGLMLNTVNQRHISVTAGTLFFVAPYRGKLRMAHLTIKDSRHRDLLCSSEK